MTELQNAKMFAWARTLRGADWLWRRSAHKCVGGLALVGLAWPAAARSNDMGSSSMSTVNISVSVAPRLSVVTIPSATNARAPGPIDVDRLCIETNAALSPLPVTAILAPVSSGSLEAVSAPHILAAELSVCAIDMKDVASPPDGSAALPYSQLVLVRPE